MFTGIIECVSEVRSSTKRDNALVLEIVRPDPWELAIGQSVAVDGVCLTVESCGDDVFVVTLVPETLAKTTFGERVPQVVNLECAMQTGDRFDGHMVQGHVDTVGRVQGVFRKGLEVKLVVEHDTKFADLTVSKGSVTLNGVSLTIVDAGKDFLSVVLIPHTLEATTLGLLHDGDPINIEFDIIGKYVNNKKEL